MCEERMTLPDKQKRQYILIAVATVLFIVVAVRYLLFPGGIGGDDIATMARKAAKLQERAAHLEILNKQLVGLSKEVAQAENGLLSGATEALAAVDLQNRLTEMATRAGMTITSQRVLKSNRDKKDKEQPYTEIPVQISGTTSIRQLKDMLYAIAASPVFLRVSDAVFKVKNKETGVLQADLTVTGIMRAIEKNEEKK
ncbi:MAG: type II secretion system protein GspM [Thermodesulfobacteriota bacterium]